VIFPKTISERFFAARQLKAPSRRLRTHRNQCLDVMAAPIVGENSIGMRLA
jgi:hypothetical protein